MDVDIATKVGAVDRAVVAGERDGKAVRAVVATRAYPADMTEVWDALTNPERIPRWFLPVSGDLRLGGRYQLEGNAGGEITACQPPRHLAATWEFGGTISWVDVRLADDPSGGTSLRLEHVVPVDDHWDEFGPGAVGVGWDLAVLGLDEHLATGGPVEGGAWMATPEGKAFVRATSDGWARAAIAAGTPAEAALAAAARTTAAYTGD